MSASSTAAAGASGWRGGAAAFLIYLGLSILFFGRALGGGLSSFYVGAGPDPPQSIWFLAWWAHALANRVNPLFTHAVWAPGGFNLAWTRPAHQWPQSHRVVSSRRPAGGFAAAQLVGGPLLRSSPTPGLMLDGLMLAPSQSHRVALGVQGSYAALKPIIDKYRAVRGRDLFSLSACALRDTATRRRAGIDDDGIRRRPACARGPRGPFARAPSAAPPPNVSATPVPSKP